MFKSVHFSVIDSFNLGWTGEATDKSSFTKAKIHKSQYGAYSRQVVFGSVFPKKVWCKVVRESLRNLRDENNKIISGVKREKRAA